MAGTPKTKWKNPPFDDEEMNSRPKTYSAGTTVPPPSSNVEMNSKGNTDTSPKTYHAVGKSPNPWHTIAAYGVIGWILFVSLGSQAVILLWSVRVLGSELPMDLPRIAAVAALLFMFYATLESQRVRWMRRPGIEMRKMADKANVSEWTK